MQMARLIGVAVVVTVCAPAAQAVNYVWWEASPRNADSSVINMGLGQTLELECAENAARCEWDVTMFLANDEIWFWWATDLIPYDPTLHVTGFQYETWIPAPQGPYFYPFENINPNTTVNGGVHDAGAFTLGYGAVPYPQSYYGVPYSLFSFTLAKLKGASWTPGLSEIRSINGFGGWGPPPPELWVHFGANPVINATTFGVMPAGPVITVLNVPEPATAALVGVAVVCLAWRGRRRVS